MKIACQKTHADILALVKARNEAERLEASIKAEMGDYDKLFDPTGSKVLITNSLVVQARVNQKALEKAHPKLVSEYLETAKAFKEESAYRKLCIQYKNLL